MLSSDPTRASLRVTSASGVDELTVVDSDFRPVAEGTGALSAALEAGIYEIVARAGPTVGRRLIKLAAAELREEVAPEVPFPASAPIRGTLMEDRQHLALVRAATGSVAGRAGSAALCVVVRDTGAGGGPPGLDLAGLDLLDATLGAVRGFRSGWRFYGDGRAGGDGRAATWMEMLEPGGYALRTGRDTDVIDQSIWLSPGWTTIVFVTVDRGAVDPGSASVHLVRLGEAWEGGTEAAATELALWGLRESRWRAGETAAALMRDGIVPANPVLQIAAAHLLLEGPRVDGRLVGAIIDDLSASSPGHPDVAALQLIAAERGVRLASQPALRLAWPPMLFASYRALLRRDAVALDAFAGGSVAERVAATLRVPSIWTTWQPIQPSDHIPPRIARTNVRPERVLEKVARNPAKAKRPKSSDPATQRVAAFLSEVADLDDGRYRSRVAQLSPAEIALATGLPAATVDRSLRRIWLSFAGLSVLPFIFTLTALVGLLVVSSLGGVVVPAALETSAPSVPSVPSSTPVALPRIEIPRLIELPASPLGVVTRTELRIPNFGEASLTILDFAIAGDAAGEFGFDERECRQGPIDPGRECVLLVTFDPAAVGDRRAELAIQTAEIGVASVMLTGTGIRSELRFVPTEVRGLKFEERREVSVAATGTIAIKSVALGGNNPTDFVLETTCEGAVLGPETGCTIAVTYRPGGEGAADAVIEVVTDDGWTWTIAVDGVLVIF